MSAAAWAAGWSTWRLREAAAAAGQVSGASRLGERRAFRGQRIHLLLVVRKVAPPSGRAGGRLRERPRKACPSHKQAAPRHCWRVPRCCCTRWWLRRGARLHDTAFNAETPALWARARQKCFPVTVLGAAECRSTPHPRPHPCKAQRAATPPPHACLRPRLHAAQVSLLRHTTGTAGRASRHLRWLAEGHCGPYCSAPFDRPLTFFCRWPPLQLPSLPPATPRSMTLASSCTEDANAAKCGGSGGAAISDTSIPGGGRKQVRLSRSLLQTLCC